MGTLKKKLAWAGLLSAMSAGALFASAGTASADYATQRCDWRGYCRTYICDDWSGDCYPAYDRPRGYYRSYYAPPAIGFYWSNGHRGGWGGHRGGYHHGGGGWGGGHGGGRGHHR